MPTPSRTSLDEIVAAGKTILESEGIEGLTMEAVAMIAGVRAPSLYKHVAGRGELVRLIVESVAHDLGRALDSSVAGADPMEDLRALAQAFRAFALDHPESYRMLFAPMPEEWRPDSGVFAAASEPVLRTAAALAGTDRALEAARLVTAWAHGFMTMELAGAFRLEGDLDKAFAFGLDRIGRALATIEPSSIASGQDE